MKRRTFLKYTSTSILFPSIVASLNASEYITVEKQLFPTNFFTNAFEVEEKKILDNKEEVEENINESISANSSEEITNTVKVEKKIKKELLNGDAFIEEKYIQEFISVREKLKLVQRHIGYGNFNILGFDDMLKIVKSSSNINDFTKEELSFFEFLFYYNPSYHGFFGERISQNITETINKNDVVKIPHTGHYLFKGEAENTYSKMCEDIGSSLTLTSGVRSIVKQTKLFLDKLDSVDGNLSIASKSLAPPAYTYHTISDFDVGKKGFGYANFTSRFALTQEFIKMRKLKYIDMRYTINNKDGVRYEPWHVKII